MARAIVPTKRDGEPWSPQVVDRVAELAHFGRSLPLRYDSENVELITLHRGALEVIQREAERSRSGLEYGGYLFRHALADETEVHEALGCGQHAHMTTNSITFDQEFAAMVEDDLRAARSDLIHCGSWHTHPSGRTAPSSVDLRSASSGFEELEEKIGDDAGVWVTLIVRPRNNEFRWRAGTGQELHPYVLYRAITGRLTWSRARLRKVD